MRRLAGRFADAIIAGEPLLVLMAIPLLIFSPSYVWQWQHSLTHYALVTEPGQRYPGVLSWLGLIMVSLPWAVRWLRQGHLTRRTPLDVPIAIYLATAALSLWPSVDRAHSLSFLLVIVAGLAAYFALVNAIQSTERLHLAVALFVVAGIGLTCFTFLTTDWAHLRGALYFPAIYQWLSLLPRLPIRAVNAGITASATLLFIPLAVALAWSENLWPIKLVWLLGAGLMALLLALSQSRGDTLALLLTVPALWLWRRRWGGAVLVVAILAASVAIVGLVLYAPGSAAQLASLYPGRWQVWQRAAYIIRDHPLTGIGLDTFLWVAQTLYPYFDYAFDQSEHAHTLLLQIGVDQGIPGLLAFAGLIVCFYRANRQAWQAAGTGTQRALAWGLCGGFTAFLLGSTVDDGVLTSRAAPAFWGLLGLGMAQACLVGEGEPAPGAVLWPWAHSRRAKGFLGAAGVLLLAVIIVVGWPILHHNLGNVYRNRGLLGSDLTGEARTALAEDTLAQYSAAGSQATRDRGALTFLAFNPWQTTSRLAGRPTVQQGAPDFLKAVAARTSPGEAVADLETAVRSGPGDHFAHLYLAEAYRTAKRLDEAAREYELAGAPVDWVVAEARRRWDWGRGDTQAALDQLAVAGLMDANAPALQEAIKLIKAKR